MLEYKDLEIENPYFPFLRLVDQYKKQKQLVIAYDFDDTVKPYYAKSGGHDVANMLRQCKAVLNAYLIVYTCNSDTEKVTKFLKENEIPYDAINQNAPFIPFNGQKLYYNCLLDDKAGLYQALTNLNNLIDLVEKGIVQKEESNVSMMQKEKERIITWIRQWFQENGPDCNAVIGISGGKDSSVVAALCVEALGNNRVIGVLMPNGKQNDIDDAISLCEFLGIRFIQININNAYVDILNQIQLGILTTPCLSNTYTINTLQVTEQTKINLPPRLRMSTLYAISQSLNGRVANTCNLSEDYVGYFTRWGDGVGDFAPLAHLTCTEVCELGKVCGLPDELVYKVPADGLCDKTDEDNLGFTYKELDDFIRGKTIANKEVLQKNSNFASPKSV